MNAHIPQSIPALAETSILMRAEAHIVSGQSSAPVNGIVQDGLNAAYIMTNTWDINSHVGDSKDFSLYTMIPIHIFKECIEEAGISEERCTNMLIRAAKYYSEYISLTRKGPVFKKKKIPGKLMASILFPPNLNYKKYTETNPNFPMVEIENGILLPNSGPLCKKVIGAKANSLIHILWLEYSPDETLRFISDCQQITDRWFPNHGFSMGIWDCMASSDEEVAKALLEMKLKIGTILEKCGGTPNADEELDINSILNSAMNVGLKLSKTSMAKGDKNALNIMRNSGGKGSLVNLTQIVAFVGQQNINGQRIPLNISGKTRALPHFQPNDHSAEARGFVGNGYLKGLTPAEVFFHAAAGRTGIISTSIKSVTHETLITIYQDNSSRTVQIGDWVDALLLENKESIQKIEEKDMEYLDITSIFKLGCSIPTVDEEGNVTWGAISAITRHDPTEYLYKITTRYGREVTVAESKSIVVWNKKLNKWEQNFPQNVKKGDMLPVTRFLPEYSSDSISPKKYLELPEHILENPHQLKRLECTRENGYLVGAIISSCSILEDGTLSLKPRFPSCKKTLHPIYCALKNLKINFCEYETNEIGISSILLKDFVKKLSRNLNRLMNTPLQFKEGMIDGYLSFGASFSHGRIKVEDHENYFIPEYNFINMLCNHFGVVTKKVDDTCFTIKGVYLTILKHTVGLTNSFLRLTDMLEYEYCGEFLKDVHFDPIKKIEKIKSDGRKLYDMTVPSTLNFCLANGLHVADTSDTGYIQKKIGRKIEDCKAYIDGTVRTSNGRIIQFLYGDDGMNPKFLYVPKGLNFPFFINPINIALRLNSDATQKMLIQRGEKPRELLGEEIELMLSYIHAGPPYLKSEVIEVATDTTRSILKKLLLNKEVILYECVIPDFCVEIKNMYEMAKIQYGEMVGLHTASFIGEPTTQMTLDSVIYETEIVVRNTQKNIFKVQIGDFVKEHIEKSKKIEYYKETDKTWAGLDEQKEYYEIMATNEEGMVEWCRIEGVSKHPVINEDGTDTMLKITTEYCKEVTATKAKSFLQLVNGKIQEVDGDSLKVGDYLPVGINHIDYAEVLELDLKTNELLPPNEYLYTSELAKAKVCMQDCRRWWLKHAGKTFILPHARSDIVVRLLKETPNGEYSTKASVLLKDHCVYMKNIGRCYYTIPEKIPLDYHFGYLLGAYCAEGCMTKHQISISNNDQNYVQPIIELCQRWNITTKYYVDKKNNYKENWTSNDLRIYNTVLCKLLEKLCGKLSHNKFVHPSIVFSNKECNLGFLDAYFGGDGYVTRSAICSSSVSKKMLTDINVILRSFSVYSYIKAHKKATKDKIFPNRVTKKENIHQGFTLYIPVKYSRKFANMLNVKIAYKQEAIEKLKVGESEYIRDKYIFNKINGENIKELRNGRFPDIKFEKIVSIEKVQNTTAYAYDLTVSKTKNFEIWPGLHLRDSFHSCGVKGKDVSLGVPRFNELLNATKSNKQKKISQTIHLEIPKIKENASKIKEWKDNSAKVKELKTENLLMLEKMKKNFLETKVGTFVQNFEMKYLGEDVDPDVNMSPIGILTYEEYDKRWWVELKEELSCEPPTFQPHHWVIHLYFDIEKLYNLDIELEEIAIAIENDSEDKYYCCASPSSMGEIEVYCNFSIMKEYVKAKMSLPQGESSDRILLTTENINYFICRDVVISYLLNIKLTGIIGVKRVFSREVAETGEWVIDTDCREIQAKTSIQRFLESLTVEGVDPYNTVVDDMHTLCATLGIEAARKFLIEELTRIISFDGVYINPRHIQLLADSMTYTGEITSVRRDGISREVGPNAKIMFEQAVDNAVEASAFSEIDDMKGVSSAIMYGLTSKAGTGMVEIKPMDQIPITPTFKKEEIKGLDITKLEEVKEKEETIYSPPSIKIETPIEKKKRINAYPGTKRKNVIRKRA
jgi:DNA-directed RNA polymerase beta' subunit